MKLIHLSEGLRYFWKSIIRKLFDAKKYSGNAEEICRGVIEDCWNGKYFMNTAGHFHEFWARDFGFTVDSLLKLGYRNRVLRTLEYALNIYKKSHIKTAINPKGVAFNFPNVYSPDSAAYFFRSLNVAGAHDLIRKNKDFLNNEIEIFFNTVIDKKTGLVKRKRHFSGMRDYYVRDSSCYDNTMVAILADTLNKIKILKNPFKRFNYPKIIKDYFWTGSYFLNDLSGSTHVSGDANVFPFWLGVFKDKEMLKSSIKAMQYKNLDKPFPLKYVGGSINEKKLWFEFLVSNWEGKCVWSHMGPLFVKLVNRIDKKQAKEYQEMYKAVIEGNKNFFELYNPPGKPYRSLFYMADESVSWAANYLTMIS